MNAERTLARENGPRNGEFLANTASIPRRLSTEIHKRLERKRISRERSVESM
jgi:hypothetical protein